MNRIDPIKYIELLYRFKATQRSVPSSYKQIKNFRMMKKIAFLMVLVLVFSCEKDLMEADALGNNADIVGTWIEQGYEDDVLWLDRSEKLDPSKYGFTIKEDGTFIEHKNAGWCATPPISYENFDGIWEALSDTLMEITVGYWGGTMTYQIRIVSLDKDNLAIRYLYAEDRAEAR
jgi:hypothetical protein